jgi:hypothetical protein
MRARARSECPPSSEVLIIEFHVPKKHFRGVEKKNVKAGALALKMLKIDVSASASSIHNKAPA